MDDEDHLLAQDMLYAEDLAERFIERDNRELTERAAADRDWTYRHVVVDEAQELSEMDWRVLMRRCPSRSFTVVGDLAQRRSAAGARSWGTMLEPYVPDRWVYRSLSVNYRTPAEIMTVAAALLAEFAPEIRPPESVRACGVLPWSRRVTEDELPTAIEEFVRDESGREGTSVVIGPPGVPGAVLPSESKGSGVRRRACRRPGPDPRQRTTRRGRALRRAHPSDPTPRRSASGTVAGVVDGTRGINRSHRRVHGTCRRPSSRPPTSRRTPVVRARRPGHDGPPGRATAVAAARHPSARG